MQITEAENQLRAPLMDEILVGLNWLLGAGISYSITLKSGEEENAYLSILKGVPMCGLRRALTKFRNGEYENMNYSCLLYTSDAADE